jgi:hypothetical protein
VVAAVRVERREKRNGPYTILETLTLTGVGWCINRLE